MDKNKKQFSLHNSRFSKKLAIPLAVVALAIGYLASAYLMHVWPFASSQAEPTGTTINTDAPSDNQLQAAKDIKKQSIEKDTQSSTGPKGSASQPATSEPKNPNTTSVNAEITAANQTDSELLVRVLIQTVSNTGECMIAISNEGGVLYTDTTGVQALPNETTCKGFDIPLNKLSKGSVSVKVSYKDGSTIASTSKIVEVK